ncbi:NAD(P)-binding domain-containing protein, partial [Pseudochrobactrum lubricantis]|uniref:NAD(P)-binding domain-containing protein n=1 Tax=Pseudochrobactrum lubricantis TaxID=558172 RepID=UPI0035DAB209
MVENESMHKRLSKIDHEVIVIGGGQAGLAASYYLRRAGVDFVIFDEGKEPGGAWVHGWDTLRLFSPASFSSLPGWLMPPSREPDGYPSRNEVINYLTLYEQRYNLPIERPRRVEAVIREGDGFRVDLSDGSSRTCLSVISATGTWSKPFIPVYPGNELFSGRQVHSASYKTADDFIDQRVLVVGGGNSGAQIMVLSQSFWKDISGLTSERSYAASSAK